MTRTASALLAASLLTLAPACGPRVDACDDACDDSTSTSPEPTSSTSTSPPATTGSTTTSTSATTLTGPDPTSTTNATTTSDVSTDSSPDTSTGEPGPTVTPGDPSPCLTGANILVLDGDRGKYVHSGSELFDDADWSFMASGDPVDDLQIYVTRESTGDAWNVWFATDDIPAPLAVGEYTDAMRPPFEDPGHPGVDTYGNGMGCNQVSGFFEIHELELVANTVTRITATWERHCEKGPLALRGCLHWEQ